MDHLEHNYVRRLFLPLLAATYCGTVACGDAGNEGRTATDQSAAGQMAAASGHSGQLGAGREATGGSPAGPAAASGAGGRAGMGAAGDVSRAGAGGAGRAAAGGAGEAGAGAGAAGRAGAGGAGAGGASASGGGSGAAGASGMAAAGSGAAGHAGSTGAAGATAGAGGASSDHSMAAVQAIFDQYCTLCHDAAKQNIPAYPALPLTADASRASLVSKPAHETCGGTLVVPGDPSHSYLVHKLSDAMPCEGDHMPRRFEGGPGPVPSLSADELAIITGWISAGAPP
jgi:hypothetical protein